MSFTRVQPCRYINALLLVIRFIMGSLTLALGQCNLVNVKASHRLTHYLLLVIKILRMDLNQILSVFYHLILLHQSRFCCIVNFELLTLKLAHFIFCDAYSLPSHLHRLNLLLCKHLSFCLRVSTVNCFHTIL